jgi:predicted nuclease of predicted toxin-antitoxin system
VAEPIKLYLDEDTISRALIRALRARGVDILTAREADQMGASDREQLEFATVRGRTIFTFNTRDFARLHTEYLTKEQTHAGIIVSDQIQVGLIVRRLLKLLNDKSSKEMQDWLEFLSNWR